MHLKQSVVLRTIFVHFLFPKSGRAQIYHFILIDHPPTHSPAFLYKSNISAGELWPVIFVLIQNDKWNTLTVIFGKLLPKSHKKKRKKTLTFPFILKKKNTHCCLFIPRATFYPSFNTVGLEGFWKHCGHQMLSICTGTHFCRGVIQTKSEHNLANKDYHS